MALDAPYQIAGVVALSGFVMCVEDWARKLQSKKGLRVLQLHGLEDRTIPYYTAPWLRDLLQKFLMDNGFRVTVATDAEDARQRMRATWHHMRTRARQPRRRSTR